ncbi:MAG TPA: serine protease [Candidatus Acidoferrum sp.]
MLGLLCVLGLPASPAADTAPNPASNSASHSAAPNSATPTSDAALSAAICPIVYPVDETPTVHGYQYIFFGNAFFISKQGYLLTAAHVLSAFRNGGGQPHILVKRPLAPPVLLKATVVAIDWQHDVALLRATPNPFAGKYLVDFLSLATADALVGDSVLAAAIRPVRVQHSQTFEAPLQDRLAGKIIDFQSTQEEKGADETKLFLFSHQVLRGQSGAPVVSPSTHEVIGIIDGIWHHPVATPLPTSTKTSAADSARKPAGLPGNPAGASAANSAGNSAANSAADQFIAAPGAAVPIHYALDLLRQQNISWDTH